MFVTYDIQCVTTYVFGFRSEWNFGIKRHKAIKTLTAPNDFNTSETYVECCCTRLKRQSKYLNKYDVTAIIVILI